jgi:hypothetical protein
VAKPVYKPATATSKALNVPVPVMPEAAKKKTPEGAKAFVGYWVAMLSYAYETGDVKTLDTLGAPECRLCHSQPRNIEALWSNGSWVEGGKLRTAAVEVKVAPRAGRVGLVAQVDQAGLKLHNATGRVIRSGDKQVSAIAFTLHFANGGWSILDTKRWVG